MALLSRFRSFSLFDYYLLLRVAIMLPVVKIRLKFEGLNSVLLWAVGPSTRPRTTATDTTFRSVHLGNIVNLVSAKGFYHANCLCRSLVLLRLMRREGFMGELRIGVAPEPNGSSSILNAHAWVEFRGVVINDHEHVASKHAVFQFN